MVTKTRDELITAATETHDRDGCTCDRKYLMSCPKLAAAILQAVAGGEPTATGAEQ